MALGSTQPLTKWVPRTFPRGKGGRCVRLTTYQHPVPLSWNLGTLTSWNRLGPSGAVTRQLMITNFAAAHYVIFLDNSLLRIAYANLFFFSYFWPPRLWHNHSNSTGRMFTNYLSPCCTIFFCCLLLLDVMTQKEKFLSGMESESSRL